MPISLNHSYLLVCVSSIGFLNATIKPALLMIQQKGLLVSLLQGFGISIVVWVSVAMAFIKILQSPKLLSSNHYVLIMILVLIAFQIPSSTISWLALAAFAGVIAFDPRNDFSTRVGGKILLAIALRDPVSSNLLQLFSPVLLEFDAVMVHKLLGLLHINTHISGNLISNINGGSLVVLESCSSLINLSYALLCWYVLSRFFMPQFKRKTFLAGFFVSVFIILINHSRLALMLLDKEMIDFFHGLIGSGLYGVLILPIVVLITLRGIDFDNAKA
jgi:hypothetical protein